MDRFQVWAFDCKLLGLSRAALYYRPAEISDYELELMALIDRQ